MGSDTVLAQLYHATRITLILWFAGVTDALCVWRCVEFFVHDPHILKKTGQCFGLNGAIFLGSILLWDYGLAPGMAWMLAGSEAWFGSSGTELLLAVLQALFGLCWLLPVYCISFALSCVWYQEIAELAVKWMGAQAGQPAAKAKAAAARPPAPILDAMAQELYRVVLFGVFYTQVSLLSFLPYVGPPLYYVLVSWLYALYSFDYSWSLARTRLPDRIHHFQTHSAFFLGFGCVCTVSTCYWPFFTQAAVIAMIYPLFILVACQSDPLAAYKRVADAEAAAGRRMALVRLPIFAPATAATGFILANFLAALRLPQLLLRNWGRLAAAACCGALLVALLAVRHVQIAQ